MSATPNIPPHSLSASSSISESSGAVEEDGLVPNDDQAVRAWLKEQGFQDGDLRSAIEDPEDEDNELHPIAMSCMKGQLNVCKWCYAHGAAADITKENAYGETPMWIACEHGHLSVCKWLFEVGATEDITKANNGGYTHMYIPFEKISVDLSQQ